ncbi:MAG: hypothetical protein AB7T06_24660 [Kofleriaceae bacterium]
MTERELQRGDLATYAGTRGVWRVTLVADGLAWLESVTQYTRMRLNGIPLAQLTRREALT